MSSANSQYQYHQPQHNALDPAGPYYSQPSSSLAGAAAAGDSLRQQVGTAKRSFDAAFTPPQQNGFGTTPSSNKKQATETTFHNYVGDPAQSLTKTPRRVGRPRKDDAYLKRPRRDPRSKPTKLRVNRPVKHGLNEDCWRLVFQHTDSATLLGLRSVDHAFNRMLTDEEHVWTANRIHHFGHECPPPPSGIPPIRYVPNRELQYSSREDAIDTEIDSNSEAINATNELTSASSSQEDRLLKVNTNNLVPRGVQCRYVDLLAGNGCMRCGVKRSKSTQWAFLRRWCQSCYRDCTVKTSEAKAILQRNSKLLYCIPRGLTDRWGNYATVAPALRRQLREEDLGSEPLDFEVHMNVFAKTDLTRIINEYENLGGAAQPSLNSSNNELSESQKRWLIKRINENERHMTERRNAEDFWNKNCKPGYDQQCAQSEYRQSRLDFFVFKTHEIDPTITAHDLIGIPTVKSSLKVKRPPTERAWNCLKDKILAALPCIRMQKESEEAATRSRESDPYRHARAGRRADREAHCPQLVFNLASAAIEKVQAESVHDADFALLVLRQTWASYSILRPDQKPTVRNSDILKPTANTEHGSYILTINDALQVYEHKISPHMKSWGVQRSQVGHSLKCPGCTRTDYSKPWRMRHLLNHLREKHGRALEQPWFEIHVAANRHNYQQGFPFPAVPWRINLPMLAQHHVANGFWNPEDTTYTQAPKKAEIDGGLTSAFHDRRPALSAFPDFNMAERFAQDLMQATSYISSCNLESKYQMKIAWEYATNQPGAAELGKQGMGPLREISIALMREGAYSVLRDCICKQCASYDNSRKPWQFHHNRDLYALHTHSFGTMIEHWDSHEQIGYTGSDNWTTEMLLLPDGADVASALVRTGMEEAREKFDLLFPCIQHGDPPKPDTDQAEETRSPSQARQQQSMLDVLADSALRQDPL